MSSVCLGIVSGKEGMARNCVCRKSEWHSGWKTRLEPDCEGVYMSVLEEFCFILVTVSQQYFQSKEVTWSNFNFRTINSVTI